MYIPSFSTCSITKELVECSDIISIPKLTDFIDKQNYGPH
jgi:hypothetical protein